VSVVHVSQLAGHVNRGQAPSWKWPNARGVPVLVDGAQSGAAPPDQTCAELGWRLLHVSRTQAVSGRRRRRALRPRGRSWRRCRVPGRRRHDPHGGRSRRRTYNGLPYKFRGGHAAHRRRIGLGRGGRITSRRPTGSRWPPTEQRPVDLRDGGAVGGPGLRLIGTAPREPAAVASFVFGGRPPARHRHHFGSEGVAIRTGHHCTQPLNGTASASRPGAAVVRRFTTRARRSTPWCARIHKVQGGVRMYGRPARAVQRS